MELALTQCPCGTGQDLQTCCGPILGGHPAPTAVALMRSRYTAFALGDVAYLGRSWHSSTAPADLDIDPDQIWTRLRILDTARGQETDTTGTVTFRAHYKVGTERGALSETSRFVRQDGHWFYLDGDVAQD
ncbi:YchJ family metal-binding protein [Jonesiaceae bacterium BS-20]|uniref:YchJ family metal-binding protein n=1 Tax=Jonesiaceae bacterium BS-20 TaxID=3120821 RepID=A0AAU7DS87_9MICO